ncbi:hypothetical protein N658DRAFT_524681 [Parathielavia hyrcaniae]|uniref:Uncharacterized protein n=1 Tax=Parathielavia hyrcaniae TaxID=113614 RepID=A0AAN6PYZ4_9PEZI|nr:hypothetical protein N658DRAFT_524681 [Parathielavia hyrcaniae]
MVSFTLFLTAFAALAAASPARGKASLQLRHEDCECAQFLIDTYNLDCEVDAVHECHYCCTPASAAFLEAPHESCDADCHPEHDDEFQCPVNVTSYTAGLHCDNHHTHA